jgi:hypothetical protein
MSKQSPSWRGEGRLLLALTTVPRLPDCNCRGEHGTTVLHWACSNDSVEIARVLLQAGPHMPAPSTSACAVSTPVVASVAVVDVALVAAVEAVVAAVAEPAW